MTNIRPHDPFSPHVAAEDAPEPETPVENEPTPVVPEPEPSAEKAATAPADQDDPLAILDALRAQEDTE